MRMICSMEVLVVTGLLVFPVSESTVITVWRILTFGMSSTLAGGTNSPSARAGASCRELAERRTRLLAGGRSSGAAPCRVVNRVRSIVQQARTREQDATLLGPSKTCLDSTT